jgi:hypothetical protein
MTTPETTASGALLDTASPATEQREMSMARSKGK